MRIVVGISGASGIRLGLKTALQLVLRNVKVHLVCSDAAFVTASYEIDGFTSLEQFFGDEIFRRIILHEAQSMDDPIASGSFFTDGMVIVPCSMNTLACIRSGIADTLLRRAADVTIKEQRRLILVPRETPFSSIHLENMLALSKNGVMIVPPIPTWYTKNSTIEEMEDLFIERILRLLHVPSRVEEWKVRG